MTTSADSLVLYAEDDENDRIFMEMAFRKVGLADVLRTVPNGLEARNYLAGSGVYADRDRNPPPSLVLLDLNMPLMSGFEVLEWIRKVPELGLLPVAIFTSSTLDRDHARAAALGVADYI
jgi:CheY-like chemotaxis protein